MNKHLLSPTDLLCVPQAHRFFPFGFPALPVLSAPISCTDLVCHSVTCLKYHCEDSGQVLSLLWKWEAEADISKLSSWRHIHSLIRQVLCLHQPGLPALTPVSLAQTFTPACPAAPWHHREVISACLQAKSPNPVSSISPNSVNGDPVLPLPHPKHHSLLFSYSHTHPACRSYRLHLPNVSGVWPRLSIPAVPLWSWPWSSVT